MLWSARELMARQRLRSRRSLDNEVERGRLAAGRLVSRRRMWTSEEVLAWERAREQDGCAPDPKAAHLEQPRERFNAQRRDAADLARLFRLCAANGLHAQARVSLLSLLRGRGLGGE